jgi:asparagine synthase (glutamine-hydrolysing)
MCGLFGIASLNPLSKNNFIRADRARDVIAHRGLDNGGSWVSTKIYIGHRRLSIIDTSISGNQPMVSENVIIAVNGEIYNFKQLRLELEQSGFVFNSNSDSEVILCGYEHWGLSKLCNKLDGMYAIVILDRRTERLIFIRDRVGIKPLYYYLDKEILIWSSELKAILDYKQPIKLEINSEAVIDFLTYRYIPAPKTFYKNVYKLCAANVFEIDLVSFAKKTYRYWFLDTTDRNASNDQNASKLISLLKESVHEQLMSDVPVGLFLSGGIDSSAIATLATEKKKLDSFTIGSDEVDNDETPYAQLMAKYIKSQHYIHYVKDSEVKALLDKLPAWFDEPFGDTSAIPTRLVSNLAKSKVKVVLSGDGGDELFGGYKWYYRYLMLRKLQKWFPLKSEQGFRFPKFIPKYKIFELLSISDPVILYSRIRKGLPAYTLKQWMKRLGVKKNYDPYWAYRQHYDKFLGDCKAAQVMDFHTYLPDDILVKVDRASMGVTLECRPPFLSKKLVDFAFSLPESFIYLNEKLKGGLKYALRDILPDQILNRSKQGFSLSTLGWKKTFASKNETMQERLLDKFLKFLGRNI